MERKLCVRIGQALVSVVLQPINHPHSDIQVNVACRMAIELCSLQHRQLTSAAAMLQQRQVLYIRTGVVVNPKSIYNGGAR